MTFTVIVEAYAERDWDEARGWYNENEPGVGERFSVTVRNLLHTLSRQPERFRLTTGLVRKHKMPPPWPYSIYFTINAEHREVKVLAIWHGAQNPVKLRRRLK
ncbi:MAG: type II toxin-antitoxin system RelE/ParE family toxin [Limisphaerales bacterium]